MNIGRDSHIFMSLFFFFMSFIIAFILSASITLGTNISVFLLDEMITDCKYYNIIDSKRMQPFEMQTFCSKGVLSVN